MNVTALSRKVRRHTPKELRGQTGAPVFMVRSLTRLENLEIMSNSKVDIPADIAAGGNLEETTQKITEKLSEGSMDKLYKISLSNLKTQLEILGVALSGWENIKDEDGDDLKFSKENIELLSDELIDDLVAEATGVTNEVTEKNSGKESPSSSGSEIAKDQSSGTVGSAEGKSSSKSEIAEEDTSQPQ